MTHRDVYGIVDSGEPSSTRFRRRAMLLEEHDRAAALMVPGGRGRQCGRPGRDPEKPRSLPRRSWSLRRAGPETSDRRSRRARPRRRSGRWRRRSNLDTPTLKGLMKREVGVGEERCGSEWWTWVCVAVQSWTIDAGRWSERPRRACAGGSPQGGRPLTRMCILPVNCGQESTSCGRFLVDVNRHDAVVCRAT
jgi:hypothetical protein